MVGIELTSLTESLSRVPVHRQVEPVLTIQGAEQKLGKWHARLLWDDDRYCFYKHLNRLPVGALASFTFDEVCKMYCSGQYISGSFGEIFDTVPKYQVVRKIWLSQRQWGGGKDRWNNIVDAHDSIRSFDLGLPEFTVNLDHTTSYNERGWSEYARVFLDGVFGFLVHHQGKHVMTVGFSIASHKRLLLHQVQLVEAKGNRFLYQWPRNRVEFVIERFRAAFQGFSVWVIDPRTSIALYRTQYERYRAWCEEQMHNNAAYLEYYEKERDRMLTRIASQERANDRIIALYENLGNFERTTEQFSTNQVVHHAIA